MEESAADSEGQSPNLDFKQKASLSLEDLVDRIFPRLNLKLFLLFLSALSTIFHAAAVTYVTALAGNIPYKDWVCVSEDCVSLFRAASAAGLEGDFFSQKTICDNNLVAGTDFDWTTQKTTFTTDWNIYCKNEAKLSLISSIYFFGALFGLLCSTAIFDRIGRKRGALLGCVIVTMGTAASAAAPNYQTLLILRVLSGFGLLINYTGSYCWIIEFAPTHLRNLVSGCYNLGWTCSYVMMVVLGYLIDKWEHLYLAVSGLCVFSLAMFFITPLPESPRFHLVRGRYEEAKKTLEYLSKISGHPISFGTVHLVYDKRVQNYFKQVKDFMKYPSMLKRSLLCMVGWFLAALITYAYTFGWSKIGSDLYTSYMFAALGGGLGYILSILVCRVLGRKRATLFFFGSVAVVNVIAMLDVDLSDTWTLEHVASLLGNVGILGAFAMLYLYTGELAPTSHRGMVMCLSSSCARVGSFIGPYVSLLYGVTDRKIPLALFAGLSVCAFVAVLFLPDTTGVGIPETPKDIEIVSEGKNRSDNVCNL